MSRPGTQDHLRIGDLPRESPPWDTPPHPHDPASRAARAGRRVTSRQVRHWALIALLVLAPLLVAEAGVRVLIATGRLPMAAAHLEDFEVTWANLDRLGSAEILVLGDSLSQQGIDPAALGSMVGRDLGRPVVAFDAASSGGSFGVSRALVLQLAREKRLPKVAIVGVSPVSLASDTTYRDVFAHTSLGQIFNDCALASSASALIDCRFGEVSALWRWRGQPARIASAVLRGQPTTLRTRGFLLRRDGFREGPPATSKSLAAQLPVALPGEPGSRTLGADAAQAFVDLVATLRADGVTVIAVAIPYSPLLKDALEARHPGWEASRLAAIQRLEALAGIAIVDPLRFGSWWSAPMSRDVKHLSRLGAPKFVEQLLGMPAFRDPLLGALGRG